MWLHAQFAERMCTPRSQSAPAAVISSAGASTSPWHSSGVDFDLRCRHRRGCVDRGFLGCSKQPIDRHGAIVELAEQESDRSRRGGRLRIDVRWRVDEGDARPTRE